MIAKMKAPTILSAVTGKPIPPGQDSDWPTRVIVSETTSCDEELAMMKEARVALDQYRKEMEEKEKQEEQEGGRATRR